MLLPFDVVEDVITTYQHVANVILADVIASGRWNSHRVKVILVLVLRH